MTVIGSILLQSSNSVTDLLQSSSNLYANPLDRRVTEKLNENEIPRNLINCIILLSYTCIDHATHLHYKECRITVHERPDPESSDFSAKSECDALVIGLPGGGGEGADMGLS